MSNTAVKKNLVSDLIFFSGGWILNKNEAFVKNFFEWRTIPYQDLNGTVHAFEHFHDVIRGKNKN